MIHPESMHTEFLNGRVTVKVGDITKEEVDAIVNAANSSLLGGGGVDGAIHRAGGAQILAECKEIRATLYPKGLPTGKAIITSGGDLTARFVIHTVGPIFGNDPENEAQLLADCYKNSLILAVEHNLKTIAFPAISTGIYGYPKDQAAGIASRTVKNFLETDRHLDEARFVFFSEADAQKFLLHQVF
jgi:O-acetyl-ADP-ribose deacetylase (regulator of RNase III)